MKGWALLSALVLGFVGPSCTSAPPLESQGATPVGTGPRRYELAIDAATTLGLKVWLEADLAKRWLAGKAAFDQGVARLAELARRPGVVGIKIADELGYRPPFRDDPTRLLAFLHDSAKALRAAAPRRLILIDMVVPELGCAPGESSVAAQSQSCRTAARARFPALRLENVDAMISSGDINVLDLSTYLQPASTYRSWGTDDIAAQRAAWQEAERRGWGQKVRLQARKALAHPGVYPGSRSDAEHDVALFVDTPRAAGAAAIDIWTWRQPYSGNIVRLMDPKNKSNDLWNALLARRAAGAVLFTHFTPSSLEVGLNADLEQVSKVFSAVFMAAGLG